MEELDEIFYLTSLDQVHTLADPLRVRIVERLVRMPMTVKMLGTDLDEPPAKIHYHVRELERIGVIRLVETREKGGVLEKYYRAVARDVSVSNDLLRTSEPSEISILFQEFFQTIQSGALTAFQYYLSHPELKETLTLSSETVWATRDEFSALLHRLADSVREYRTPRGVEGEQEWTINVIAHAVVPEKEAAEAVQEPPEPKKLHRTYGIGVFDYSRKDLQSLLAEGRQLDLNVVGICSFADDISPDLADRAVAQIRVYGVLHASPEVRAVLQRKGGERSQQDSHQ